MNLGELHKALSDQIYAGVPLDTPVGNRDHYGKLETEVDGVTFWPASKANDNTPFIQLDGMPSGYPEPD